MTKIMTEENLRLNVPLSTNYSDLLRRMGMKVSGGSLTRAKERVELLGLDTSHFRPYRGMPERYPDEELFTSDSTFQTNHRRRFLKLVEYKCVICGISDWLGKALTLQVDHIDGNNRNNLLSNLRLLCPNCHAQTDTWGVPLSKRKLNSVK